MKKENITDVNKEKKKFRMKNEKTQEAFSYERKWAPFRYAHNIRIICITSYKQHRKIPGL